MKEKESKARSSQPDETRPVRERILDWAAPGFPLEIREEAVRIHGEYMQQKTSEDVDAYTTELAFGTGGLRGVIGTGPGRMNRWTVGKATVGFCNYLLANTKEPSLVIAFDSRRMSNEFSRVTAGIAVKMGFRVHLFDSPTPTPVLSYAIRKLKASGGVVITASHNPPEYNGYKVYISDGSQMVGPPQVEVEKNIAAVTSWTGIPFLDENSDEFKGNVRMIGDDIRNLYYSEFDNQFFVSPPNSLKAEKTIVYSPLHGTGGAWLPGLLERFGFSVDMVESQALPDGEFPTVKYPNPEEPEALRLAEEKARQIGAALFLATDPDADRLGAGIRNEKGEYVLINGNQIGSILCAYMAEKAAEDPGDRSFNIVKTIVTSDLQQKIAVGNGIRIHDVLTGFKYVAEQMRFMEEGVGTYKKGKDFFLFGGEESFGYLPVDFVRDKDSLSSALLFAEIMNEKGDLLHYLDEIYMKYGLYLELLKSVTIKGSAGVQKIKETINRLRSESLEGVALGNRKVSAVVDYQNKTRNGKADPAFFGNLPESNVIQFELEPEGKITIRPSGTEPKVKLYVSLAAAEAPADMAQLQKKKNDLQNELISIAGLFFAKTGLNG